jgi:chromosome segregation protein
LPPSTNPLQKALDSAREEAEQKQVAAAEADANAQQLRAHADQATQEVEAADQEYQAFIKAATIDKNGLEYKSKLELIRERQLAAATADKEATEAAEAAEVAAKAAHKEAAQAQQRVAKAQQDLEENAQAAEDAKVAYDAASAAVKNREGVIRELNAQLEVEYRCGCGQPSSNLNTMTALAR